MKPAAAKSLNAFTLVELSIVLVILGLLVGGVLAGQSLIRSAELRAVLTERDRYVTALNTFRDKYFAIPGDMNNATSYWGVLDASYGVCITSPSTDLKTCNGNGDSTINYYSQTHESFHAWQHLSNAGLIEGRYDGWEHNSGGITYIPGTNIPRSKIAQAMWIVWSFAGRASDDWSPQNAGLFFIFAGPSANGHQWWNPVLKPEEAYSIDKKVDDGKPYTGSVNSMFGGAYTSSCAAAQNAAADYNLSYASAGCILFFDAMR